MSVAASSPFREPKRWVVLDSSVVIKWFCRDEVLATEALAWRQAYLDGACSVVLPHLLMWEVSNVLRFKHGWKLPDVRLAVDSLFRLGLEWVPPELSLAHRALHLAFEYETTVYDAAFAALAESRSGQLITADQRLVGKMEGFEHIVFLGDSVPPESN